MARTLSDIKKAGIESGKLGAGTYTSGGFKSVPTTEVASIPTVPTASAGIAEDLNLVSPTVSTKSLVEELNLVEPTAQPTSLNEATKWALGMKKENLPKPTFEESVKTAPATAQASAKEYLAGGLKAVEEMVKSASKAGEKIESSIAKIVLPDSLYNKYIAPSAETPSGETLLPESMLEAKGTKEKIGKTVADIATFFAVPEAKLAQASTKGLKALELLKTSLSAAGISSLQTGDIGTESAIAGGIAGLSPVVAGILNKVGKIAFTAGVNPEAATAEKIQKYAAEAIKKYGGTRTNILNSAKKTISESGTQLKNLLKDVTQKWNPEDLVSGVLDRAKKFESTGAVNKVEALLKRAVSWVEAQGGKSLTAEEMLTQKRLISEELSSVFSKGKSEDPLVQAEKQALVEIWSKLDESLDSISPEVAKLNEQMTVAYSLKDPIEKSLKKPLLTVTKGLWQVPQDIFSLVGIPTATRAGQALSKTAQSLQNGWLLNYLLSVPTQTYNQKESAKSK